MRYAAVTIRMTAKHPIVAQPLPNIGSTHKVTCVKKASAPAGDAFKLAIPGRQAEAVHFRSTALAEGVYLSAGASLPALCCSSPNLLARQQYPSVQRYQKVLCTLRSHDIHQDASTVGELS